MIQRRMVSSCIIPVDETFNLREIRLECGHVICVGVYENMAGVYGCGECTNQEYIRQGLRIDPTQRSRCHKTLSACRGCPNLCP